MTGVLRSLGTPALLIALSTAAPAAQDAQASFEKGVELLQRGRDQEALVEFKKALAADPGHEEAFELFQSTEHEVWLQMLVKGGDFEMVAKRLMGLAELGRLERRDDADAIRELLDRVLADDVVERTAALRQLAAEHGEYAVPHLLRRVADRSDEDSRVLAMYALTVMGDDVVVPLIEAMSADDAFLRRNVALVLGRIGDPRSAGILAWHAASDPDAGVKAAAEEALQGMRASRDAAALFLQAGDDYHFKRHTVLAPHMFSDVVWSWEGEGLSSTPVPRSIYNDEMAKKSYYRALAASPGSLEARAGIARAFVAEANDLDAAEAAGLDVGDWQDVARDGEAAVMLTGVDALDAALRVSVSEKDAAVGAALARTLGDVAYAPTGGLDAALRSGDGAMRSEAALALGRISLRGASPAGGDVVRALAEAAGREIVQIAIVIDGDVQRSNAISEGLTAQGMSVNVWRRGAQGLAMMQRLPGFDVVVVADTLPDLTTSQVISEIRRDEERGEIPIVIVSDDVEQAEEIFGDAATAYVTGTDNLDDVVEAAAGVDGDRAKARGLAADAAELLVALAGAGSDLGPAVDALAGNVDRDDDVAVPSMRALALAGSAAHVDPLVSVAADEARSDASRAAAAHAVAGIVGRTGATVSDEALGALRGVMSSSASPEVRRAAAHALGSLDLDPAVQLELLEGARVGAS